MILRDDPPLHLTYCLNIHPGETWAEHFEAIRHYAVQVRDRLGRRPFGLGLRIGRDAVDELGDPETRRTFIDFMAGEDLYTYTINGFPYGRFHGARVKEQVYAPDWRSEERLTYTNRLADILADLLPGQTVGSISTVPGSFKPWIRNDADVDAMVANVAACALHLHDLYRTRGIYIHLGLEPEPCCYLETTDEFIAFFERHLMRAGRRRVAEALSCDEDTAGQILRRHVGINFDCCHLAIQYEDLAASLQRLIDAGILISKVHLSAALICDPRRHLEELVPFDEPVYFHQVKGRTPDGSIRSWDDLPDALVALREDNPCDELRCHFHVPLFWRGSSTLGTTAQAMTPAFFDLLRSGACSHLEIETYTFDVLPPELRRDSVVDSLVPEFEWTLDRLG